MSYRSWDWHLPFFYGFNQFYFLKKPEEAAIYLSKAYQLNPKNEFLPTLIARLYYQADETEVAIDFLEEMIRNSKSEKLRKWMSIRLQAFRIVAFLEDATVRYQERYKRRPRKLQALVAGGILKAIPPDPYGGEFYLDDQGRVSTTSNFAYEQKKPRKSGG
jgi:tetratricopeptide (TPR) repeat protein